MKDSFETIEQTPIEVQQVVASFFEKQYEGKTEGYSICRNLVNELLKIGWTCDYGLDSEPFNLHPIPNVLPTVMDYNNFLDEVVQKTKITKENARKAYSKFTYVDWYKFLAA
jgi:hypothetical protein